MPVRQVARPHHVVAAIRQASSFRRAKLFTKRVKWPSAATPSRSQAPAASQPRNNPPTQEDKPAAAHNATRKSPPKFGIAFVSALGLAGAMGLYISSLAFSVWRNKPQPGIEQLENQKDVAGRYEATADDFDSDVGLSEVLMGLTLNRRALAQKCVGHVLEASCGTGRNLGYFDLGPAGPVDSLTLVDLSPAMIDVCKRKWTALAAGGGRAHMKPCLTVRFLAGSALEPMPPPPPPSTAGDGAPSAAPPRQKYDTILQTMGLCSTPAPVQLLTNLAAHLEPSNPQARILLLEHGRGWPDWLNRILDGAAPAHAVRHGCWFNRDIGALVADAAAQAGLEVVSVRRRHFGTTWIYELKLAEAKAVLPGPAAVATPWFAWGRRD